MAHSPSLRFFNGFRNNKKEEQLEKDNVKGWLVNVHSYRDDKLTNNTSSSSSEYILVDEDNNRIPLETGSGRNGRPESIASEDSVNLDDLINNNFTADMEDETDLPDLADLDLDDSTDDFFKMESKANNNDEELDSFDTGFNDFMTKPSELDWSPKEENKVQEKTPRLSPPSPPYLRRSDSFSSENSLTSQSTITQYQRYGMTPLIYPSESTSTSSRSHSRLSNYSASSFASSSTASGIPHRAATTATTNNNNNNSSNHSNNHSNSSLLHHHHQQQQQHHHTTTKTKTPSSTNIGIPTPSRSYTYRDNKSQHLVTPSQRATPLAKRASHIPAPQSASKILPPSPQRTSSSSSARSTGLPTARRTMTPTSTAGHRLQQRSSHIPSARGGESDNRRFLTAAKEDSTSRPTSPLFNGRSASRLGGGSGKKSLFQDRPRSTTPNANRSGIPSGIPSGTPSGIPSAVPQRTEEKRVMSPTGTRPSGIRPPGASGLRAPSRIGTIKKA